MNEKIKNIIVNYKETIINALKVIDKAAKGIVYVVDDDYKLMGTLTDGDIRRAIINNINLNENAGMIMNDDPVKVIEGTDVNIQKEIMIKRAIRELPIINAQGVLVDSISLNELLIPKGKKNFVIIMAGGLGSRLKELTKEIPKPMLNLGDKPILQHIIENFKKCGFNKFLISVNYKSEVIENYFQNGCNYGCKINYLKEQQRLGTGGAISLAKDYIDDDFFVVNGDIYSTVNFNNIMDFHKKNKNDITIVSIKKDMNIPYGVIELDGNNVSKIVEKPQYSFVISGGMYCLSTKVMEMIPKNKYYEITELFEQAIKTGLKVKSYIINDYWMDIGRIDDYNKANKDMYELMCSSKDGENDDRE